MARPSPLPVAMAAAQAFAARMVGLPIQRAYNAIGSYLWLHVGAFVYEIPAYRKAP
jgi:hypothetical protein